MILTLGIYDEFGSFCGNGEAALRFRRERIDPYINLAERIELDFARVRNANSSFCNALVANLIEQNSPALLPRLKFLNCSPQLQVMLRSAVDLGLSRLEHQGAQLG